MSEIHIGPHTRDDDAQSPGEPHHAFDREINTRAIAKWMAALLAVTVIVELGMWGLLRGMERFDQKGDPELTPIQQEMKQPLPPAPRLQVGQNFRSTNNTLNEEGDGKVDPEQESLPMETRIGLTYNALEQALREWKQTLRQMNRLPVAA